VSSQWPLSVCEVLVACLYVSVLTRLSAPAHTTCRIGLLNAQVSDFFNSLPVTLVNMPHISQFNTALKRYLIDMHNRSTYSLGMVGLNRYVVVIRYICSFILSILNWLDRHR